MNNIYDDLYNAILKLNTIEKNDCVIIHPYCFQVDKLPKKYQSLGYPNGKSKKGWKKWFRKEVEKLQYLNIDIKQ